MTEVNNTVSIHVGCSNLRHFIVKNIVVVMMMMMRMMMMREKMIIMVIILEIDEIGWQLSPHPHSKLQMSCLRE